jgi:hypothetical protein
MEDSKNQKLSLDDLDDVAGGTGTSNVLTMDMCQVTDSSAECTEGAWSPRSRDNMTRICIACNWYSSTYNACAQKGNKLVRSGFSDINGVNLILRRDINSNLFN